MSDRAVQIPYADMDPVMRAMLTYEDNGTIDGKCPFSRLVDLATETPVVRWEMGVGFFSMADVVAVGNHPRSCRPTRSTTSRWAWARVSRSSLSTSTATYTVTTAS